MSMRLTAKVKYDKCIIDVDRVVYGIWAVLRQISVKIHLWLFYLEPLQLFFSLDVCILCPLKLEARNCMSYVHNDNIFKSLVNRIGLVEYIKT